MHSNVCRLSGERSEGAEAQEGEETLSNEESWMKSLTHRREKPPLGKKMWRARANA